MATLIIVESPEKSRTIQRILGDNYRVIASKGHIRDLPKNVLAVDIEHDFEPEYVEMADKKAVIKELREAVSGCEHVLLATDPDREGEAISWHLASVLGLNQHLKNRVTFNEITAHGIKEGMQNPRTIDIELVDAQQTRRILDRIVGYKLSPFLWRKVRKGLSAGRVQSVVVKLVVEREREILAFIPVEFWTIDALLQQSGGSFKARFFGDKNGEIKLSDKQTADAILEKVKAGSFTVTAVKTAPRKRRPSPPFTTSTLQQEASRRLGMRSERTMQVAQRLYEGVNIPGMGEVGLITYMRTDSLRISDEAATAAAEFIRSTYGDNYLPAKRNIYKAKNAQDAHEAIRPTMPRVSPDKIAHCLTPEQNKLYRLIWNRFIASQMAECIMKSVSAELDSAGYLFKATGVSVVFDGFTVLYDNNTDEKEQTAAVLQSLNAGDKPECLEVTGEQHFTQPPARYNEATLIAAMEEKGIGRPSTYAPIISTIIKREYVLREAKVFRPTPLGEAVTDLLAEQFPKIVDVDFTAGMEEELDGVEQGTQDMKKVLHTFYDDFAATLDAATEAMQGKRVKLPDEESGELCEKCGKPMVIKLGRFGKFFACSGYPDCKNTKPYQEVTAGFCPLCGKPMVKRIGRNGGTFYGCTGYPDCKFMSWDEPIAEPCPKCGTPMFKSTRKGAKPYCMKPECGFNAPPPRESRKSTAKANDGEEKPAGKAKKAATKSTAKSAAKTKSAASKPAAETEAKASTKAATKSTAKSAAKTKSAVSKPATKSTAKSTAKTTSKAKKAVDKEGSDE